MIETLAATNQTFGICGIKIRDQSALLIGLSASVGSVALLMVIVRLLDRGISMTAELGWDDLLIGVSGVLSIGMNGPVIAAGVMGFGRDMWAMTPDNITASLKVLYVAYFTYMLSECFCQLSILAFYLRIMVNKKIRMAVWVLIIMVIGFGIGNTVAMIFQSTPIRYFWDGWKGDMVGYYGVDVRLFGFIRGSFEILLDLVILSLPLPMLLALQMSRKKKAQIISMFCVGFIITIVSCIRLWSFVRFAQSTNPTYDNTAGLITCATEGNLFIVVACMPAMHAFLRRTFRSARNKYGSGTRVQYDSGHASKGSYVRHDSSSQKNDHLPFGVINKTTDVTVYHTNRSSSSDVELVPIDGPMRSL
ncbi:hypothetical protein EJ05DRAFT_498643 [Pseudovirgaria hyperparasitica]|uniref:Rhodopsin domain-containing protein n=1 Tax=Pseudovirgaria hyperparasitica TaxID=470096 RepID=A0A6A6WB77_9PEZI|nr:uncharacterized protein EJ05DRAFT_498643 [Pseudovirgaria hyperparasitica]KAF2759429.1 hypothetical protein EJ05DRAFT_498643 [Pseudovirgaria hyperparasitica]